MGKIGIYGGSFDPIHNGHLITALYVLERRSLDKIIFIPCNISPHKLTQNYSENIHRLKMVELAVEDFPNFEVSDYEITKGDVSYSYDTIKHFSEQYRSIELIIGYDNLVVFDTWKNPDEILDLARLLVLKRSSISGEKTIHKYYEKAVFMQNPTIELSSTDIRARISKNLVVNSMIPDKVLEYIKSNNLYVKNEI